MKYVEFKKLLEQYRIRSKLNKTRLAERLDVSAGYYMLIESGLRKPPPLNKCENLAKILNLNEKEKKEFIEAAVRERAKNETLDWLENKSDQIYRIPVVSWSHVSAITVAENYIPLVAAEDYIITTTRGG